MPSFLAIENAVRTWSPVIITVDIPAVTVATPAALHSATASLTPSFIPSVIPHSPRNISPSSVAAPSKLLYAKPKTRSASSDMALPASAILRLNSFVSGFTPSPVNTNEHFSIRISGAPLTKLHLSPLKSAATVIIFLSDVNGISARRVNGLSKPLSSA